MKRLHTPGRKRYGNNKALLKSRLVTALPVSVSPLFAARVHFSVIPHWITTALGLAGGNRQLENSSPGFRPLKSKTRKMRQKHKKMVQTAIDERPPLGYTERKQI